MWEWMYRSTFSWPRHLLVVSGELHIWWHIWIHRKNYKNSLKLITQFLYCNIADPFNTRRKIWVLGIQGLRALFAYSACRVSVSSAEHWRPHNFCLFSTHSRVFWACFVYFNFQCVENYFRSFGDFERPEICSILPLCSMCNLIYCCKSSQKIFTKFWQTF
jgi:hypothetical protein